MRDDQLLEVIERYLNGEMNADERKAFEQLRKENADIDNRAVEHQQFTGLLKQYGERMELENRLNAIHQEIDVHAIAEEVMIHPSWIVQLWRHHHSKISVAASIAIFAILSTLFFTGYFVRNQSSFQSLKLEVDQVKKTNEHLTRVTNGLIHTTKQPGRPVVNPSKFIGTGFALTSSGYIVTNYHVINGADSVYVQNMIGSAYRAKVVYSEPQYDVAILKITDTSFKNLGVLPYSFKRSKSDMGEDVYTIGYPGDAVVFGPGFLTSVTGFKGDTSEYQVSIPVNPGNSGGPLLDSKGNIIGIISGRQTQTEGAAFAVKSAYLLKTIQNIPDDSVKNRINLNSKNAMSNLNRVQQIKKMQSYVFMVKVYN